MVAVPVLHNEGEEVGHGGGPQLAQGVVIEAGVQADHLKLDTYYNRHGQLE